MADLTDSQKTDNVDDHVAADYNYLLGGILRASLVNTQTITATKELADIDYQIQVITPSGANRTVELAPEATTNHVTVVRNPTGSTYDVVLKNDSGATTHCTLDAGEWALCIPTGSIWMVIYSGDLGVSTASGISITDAGGYYSGSDVEAALQEAGADIASNTAALMGMPLQVSTYNNTAADGTTYFFGGLHGSAWGTGSAARSITIPVDGTVKKAYLLITFAGTPTSENWTISFRLNDTTDTTISSTVDLSGGSPVTVSKTDLNIAVVAGNTFEIKVAVPTMTTNPTAVSVSGLVYME